MKKHFVGIAAACAAVSLVAVAFVPTAQAVYPVTQEVRGHQWGTTSGTIVWAQMGCPAGKYATGGGGGTDMSNWTLQKSLPLVEAGAPRGWRAEFRYTGGVPINASYDIYVSVLCTT